jgi:hypothetical protein
MSDANDKEARRKQKYEQYLEKSEKAMLRAKEYDRRARVIEQDAFLSRKARNHAFIIIASQLVFLALKKDEESTKFALKTILQSIKRKSHEEYETVMSVLNSSTNKG